MVWTGDAKDLPLVPDTPFLTLWTPEREPARVTGLITITTRDAAGRIEVEHYCNQITYGNIDNLAKFLKGDLTDGKVKYVALGSSTTAVAASQTALGSEQFRKAVTTQWYPAATHGQLVTRVYIAGDEATTFSIQEVGWFAGPAASATPGSGVMIARVLWAKGAKTNLESIQIDRTDVWSYS